jgi:hypothetical protein
VTVPVGSTEKAREHAWRYFDLHAQQRITVFNYFIIFAGLILAGLASTLQRGEYAVFGVLFGVLLALLSFVFWQLDRRAAFLVKHAECALEELERALPAEAQLFRKEPTASKPIWLWTYGRSFRFIFLVMALIGLGGAALSGLQLTGKLKLQQSTQKQVTARR